MYALYFHGSVHVETGTGRSLDREHCSIDKQRLLSESINRRII